MKQKQELQYRYYEMPVNSYIIALLGSSWIRPYGLDITSLHYHNYMEIGYCLYGTGTMIFGETVYEYGPGCFTIIPENYPHNTISIEGKNSHWEYLFIDTKSFINDIYHNNSRMRLSLHEKMESQTHFFYFSQEKEILQLILLIMNTFRHKEDLYQEVAKGFLLALIVRISKLTNSLGQNLLIENSDIKMIVDAFKYVELNYSNDITISDLANECHISETHFRRVFKQSTGIPPLTYVNLFRIESACRMMRTTTKVISDVALQCGFSSQPSFNRVFKTLVGITPTQWRKNTELDAFYIQTQNIIAFNGWQ